MKWLEGQSRFMMRTFLGRRYDTLTDSAQQTVRIVVAGVDVVALVMFLKWLF